MPSSNPSNPVLPLLPLKNTVVFPYLFVPLSAGRRLSLGAVEAALLSEEKSIILVAQRNPMVDIPGISDLFTIGTKGIIRKTVRSEDRIDFLVQGTERVALLNVEKTNPYLEGSVNTLFFSADQGIEVEALQRAVLELAERILKLGQTQITFNIEQLAERTGDPLQLAYMLASMLNLDIEREQSLLEANSTLSVLRMLLNYMAHEVEVLELRNKITSHAQTEMNRQQKEYLLRQQLRAIQEELGEQNLEKSELEELRLKLKDANLPEATWTEVERELIRLERLPPTAPDYQIIRSHLDFIVDLPWNRSTQDNIDLIKAKEILDQDHYNLEEIKSRILEQLAVMKLNPQAKSPILCFVGPPGVGKTSLGRSIGSAIGRKFERMSLGGLHDEAELRGHRRTYIGAMPGRILQAIRRAGVNNPILMLDEIDKIGHDFRGDPSSALLEILDPSQNHNFRDNYLDLPFDLSKVLFITTANTLETIPGPLLDRMETLRLSGYTEEEKAQIARRYLIPNRLKEAGLTEKELQIPETTLLLIIARYTRESGVRELERTIGRLASKVARRFAEGNLEPFVATPEQLPELLGIEKFRPEKLRKILPPGVATALAWTPVGGELLYIEAHIIPNSDELRLTGQLGDVMRESAKAAQTYLWSNAGNYDISPALFQKTGLHIHVPAGATPKDGPSAGVAMVAAMASAFMQTPCRNDLAMTGEITLSGLVLPVGGIKEKILAAKRAGITQVILPGENEKDLRDLPEIVRKEMNFTLVDNIESVLTIAIPKLFRSSLTKTTKAAA
ncbi:MAG: endopeptidase La [Bdellovibrionia bacterium]